MIIEDYSKHIDNFSNYLTDKLESISKISGDNHILFQKILYVSFLDSLSACIYPERTNRERFLSLIDRFSHWKERDNVSLSHLGKMVSLSSDPELEKVRNFVNSELEKWKHRTNEDILISEDPTYDEIKNLGWEKGKKFGLDMSLPDFKQSNLLYQLRNSLVHQFQAKNELGSNTPKQPFYRVHQNLEEDGTLKPLRIELVYPSSFLESISQTVLKNVVKYLKDGNINPFPHYYAGDYWLDKLN